MPNSRNDSQYAGASRMQGGTRKYKGAKRVKKFGAMVRILSDEEIAEFQNGIQRIVDREPPAIPAMRRAVV